MPYAVPYHPEHVAMAQELVREMDTHGGLAPVDLERFWAEQEVSERDPFGRDTPQVPLGAILTGECVYDELGIPVDMWRYDTDHAWRLSVNTAYNDAAERIVGKRILSEAPFDAAREYPRVRGLNDVFEAENVWHDQSWWLQQSARNPSELEALLDRVDGRDIRGFILPAGWDAARRRLRAMGVEGPLYRGQRGPVTFATSVYGPENLIYLILEQPDLARRFSNTILKTMLEIGRVLDEEAGYTPETAPRGFSFCDDNCCLLSPDMYELFGYPVLEGVFARYSSGAADLRYQHSDSAMEHLLPLLGRLGLNGANFGPTVPVKAIREHLPQAVIYGQLAPFTYSRNESEHIVLEFLRDFDMARESRGLVFATAGSINNGTRLTSMRLAMAAIQRYGRY